MASKKIQEVPTFLTEKDWHMPPNSITRDRLHALLQAASSEQLVAADLAYTSEGAQMRGLCPAIRSGKICRCFITIGEALAAGETIAYTLRRGTTAVASITVDSTAVVGAPIDIEFDDTVANYDHITIGDVFAVTRDYTASGGGDTAPANRVTLLWTTGG